MKKILALLVVLLVLPFPSFALSYMTTETRINNDNTVHSALTISTDSSGTGTIIVPVFGDVENLVYDANFDGFSCTIENKPYGHDAVCDVSKLKRSGSFKIEFDSVKMIEKADGQYTFKQQISTPLNLDRLTVKIILPEGTALSKTAPYLPFDASNSTDGRNIFVFWNRENVVAGEVFAAQVSYERFFQDQGLIIAGIFAAVLVAAILALVYRRKFSMKMVLPVLRQDEKNIMEKIIQNRSGVNQKIIVNESGYSKAKVSKVLKSLEERGVVKLERIGRSNRIFLESNLDNKDKKDVKNSRKA